VNDSKATNVDATYTGVKGVRGRKAVVLLGGLAKAGPGDGSLGFTRLVEVLQPHRAVVLVNEALPFSLELFVHFPNVCGLLEQTHESRRPVGIPNSRCIAQERFPVDRSPTKKLTHIWLCMMWLECT
jgi:hypothetical protein